MTGPGWCHIRADLWALGGGVRSGNSRGTELPQKSAVIQGSTVLPFLTGERPNFAPPPMLFG